jgi:hypothetical protein
MRKAVVFLESEMSFFKLQKIYIKIISEITGDGIS